MYKYEITMEYVVTGETQIDAMRKLYQGLEKDVEVKHIKTIEIERVEDED